MVMLGDAPKSISLKIKLPDLTPIASESDRTEIGVVIGTLPFRFSVGSCLVRLA